MMADHQAMIDQQQTASAPANNSHHQSKQPSTGTKGLLSSESDVVPSDVIMMSHGFVTCSNNCGGGSNMNSLTTDAVNSQKLMNGTKGHQQVTYASGMSGNVNVGSGPTASSSLNGNQNPKKNNHLKNHRKNGKLGSDGESEASPETSLSPVDVDSLEGCYYSHVFPL